MRKVIAAINMTMDGFCDHTAITPDETIHQHYADLLSQGDVILYGRTTYQLMTYWKSVVENPTGNEAMDAFAVIMDKIPKIVFSRTLKELDWDSARLSESPLQEKVTALKQQKGRPILVGSRSLIIQLLKAGLIDELQLCMHPVVAGGGLPLFDHTGRIHFRRTGIKTFDSGAIIMYYEPAQ